MTSSAGCSSCPPRRSSRTKSTAGRRSSRRPPTATRRPAGPCGPCSPAWWAATSSQARRGRPACRGRRRQRGATA
eukprot:5189437-Prymnesium_polylepis.2